MVRFAFASLLACKKGHFACFIFKPFSISALSLLSIPLIGFSAALTHNIKEQILLSCHHTFLIKVLGRIN